MKYILGVDIGITNLGLVGVYTDDSYYLDRVDFCELVNITNIKCFNKNCGIKHSLNVAYYMKHLFRNYNDLFEKADHIVIERQPIPGITDVQEIILYQYEHKSELISPNAMHKFYGIGDLPYDDRKIFTIKFSSKHLESFESFKIADRKHDMADSFCIINYYIHLKREKLERIAYLEKCRIGTINFMLNLEKFKYNGI